MLLRSWLWSFRRVRFTAGLCGVPFLTGCVTPLGPPLPSPTPAVRQIAHTTTAPPLGADPPFELPLVGAAELTESAVIEVTLARNPTVAQMAAAWRAAAARYPQVTSLEDPRVGGYFGPASIGSPDVDFAYRVEISQSFPSPGKRELRGRGVRNEAAAAGAELEDTRLQLVEAARAAFAEYFLVRRLSEVGEENLKFLERLRDDAVSRFKAGKTSLQDSLQAEVAVARQRERLLTLDRQRTVARARLNTLMHLPPDHPLPPPPKQLDALPKLPPVAELRARAGRRPDVEALARRVAADEAAVELALKEYNPDFEAMAAYDAWWQSPEKALRPMIGLRSNLPVRFARRSGAVEETKARLAQRRAELARLTDRVSFEVQEAYEQAVESDRVLALYQETTLPTARRNVELATSEYAAGRVPFLNLVEAQRNLVELRERYFDVSAELLRRRAALERATGAGR